MPDRAGTGGIQYFPSDIDMGVPRRSEGDAHGHAALAWPLPHDNVKRNLRAGTCSASHSVPVPCERRGPAHWNHAPAPH